MRILAESRINQTSNNTIYDIIRAKRTQVAKQISLFPKLSEKKKLITEGKKLSEECAKDSKLAYSLLSDFEIAKKDTDMYLTKSQNIKSFAKHEFISAKKLIDEADGLTKNEKKRRKDNNNTYVRVKKKKFAGGLEIDDYKNGKLTRKILKTGKTITITAQDVNDNTSILTFDNDGNLIAYFEGVTTSKDDFTAKEKFTYSNGNLSSIDLDYKKLGDNSETIKKHFVLKENKLEELFKNYNKYTNQETEISAEDYFVYSSKNTPYRYCKNYSIKTNKEESTELEFKYETIDFLTFLKECKKETTENSKERTIISRYKKRTLKAIYIQDIQTKHLRYFTFDLEGNPINYYEDTLES